MKHLVLFCALMLAVGALLVSCKGEQAPPQPTAEPSQTLPPAEPGAFDLTDCVITRPQAARGWLLEASREISSALSASVGATVLMKDDLLAAPAGEILLGETNRPESAEAAGLLASEQFAFCICRRGDAIVIAGTTDEMTVMGAQSLAGTLVPSGAAADGVLHQEQDYVYVQRAGAVRVVADGGSDYAVVSSLAFNDSGTMACVQEISGCLRELTGRNPSYRADSRDPDAARDPDRHEILLGGTYYAETYAVMERLGYHQYGVAVEDNKIVVFGYSEESMQKATELFGEIMENNTDGNNVTLPQGMLVRLSDGPDPKLPLFPAALQRTVTVEGEADMIYVTGATQEQLAAYGGLLTAEGYTLYASHSIGQCRFETYAKEDRTLSCGWDPSDGTIRIVTDRGTARPQTSSWAESKRVCDTLLTQIGLNYLSVDSGMSYVLRLADGRFLVFDGGSDDFDETKKLYDLLCSQCVTGERPVIAAWFLTHAHEDHYGAFLAFAGQYAGQVTVERVVYNLPTASFNANMSGAAPAIDSRIAAIPGAEIVYARTGQKHCIANAEVEVLLTPEDFYPSAIRYDNDTSVVYRVKCEGQTFLVLGDSVYDGAQILLRRYGDALQSDIMQVAHHGYDGTDALYRAIDPTIVLWPCPDQWYHEARRWDEVDRWIFNQYLVTSPNIRETFNSGHGTAVLRLPYTAGEPQTPSVPAAGEVLYHEDFESLENLYQTGWFYINSLVESYQYTDVSLTTQAGDRGLLMKGYDNSVLCFVRPDVLQDVPVYTLQLRLQINDQGHGFGIWYNDASPIDSQGRCLYPVSQSGSVLLTMEVDREAGLTRVWINGAEQPAVQNASNDAGGLIFWSSGAEVFVGEVILTAGAADAA